MRLQIFLKKIIKRSKEKILEEIKTLDDPELQKALIAEITDEFLKNNKERVNQNKNQEMPPKIPPKIVSKTRFIDEKKIA